MVSVSYDCSLMTQMLPARLIDPVKQFFVLRDVNGEPMVFSTSNEGILYVTLSGPTGNNELVNLSEKFHISASDRILALNVTQDQDGTIYLVFAHGRNDSESTVCVMEPKNPQEIAWFDQSDLTHLLYSGSREPIAVQKILLVGFPNLRHYMLIEIHT